MIPPEMRLKQLETAVGPCAWQPRGSHVHGPADIGNHRIDNENTLGVDGMKNEFRVLTNRKSSVEVKVNS